MTCASQGTGLFLSCLILTTFLFGCTAQQNKSQLKLNTDNNTLLWQISGNGLEKPSYLFGTFHLLCREDIHFSPQLKKAIELSDEIYMEMDMDDPSTLLSGFLYMNMKDGKTLRDFYKPGEYKKIESYFNDTLHTPITFNSV